MLTMVYRNSVYFLWAVACRSMILQDMIITIAQANDSGVNNGSMLSQNQILVLHCRLMAIEGIYRVGIYILSDINTIETLNPGIYRDDFLAVTSANPQQTE